MSTDKRARLKQWLESGEARLYPLTFPQRELWEVSPVPPSDIANHICCLIEVRGAITQEDCLAAIQRVVDRQDVLRLSILPGKDQPLQMVRKKLETNFQFRELTASQTPPEALEELAQEVFSQPFDMVGGPLYRIELLRRTPQDHVLVFAVHHAIADGWSLGAFIQDLGVSYVQGVMGKRGPLPPLPCSYMSWGAAEREAWPADLLRARADFWKKQLDGAMRLWPRQPVAPTPSRPQRWVSEFSPELVQAVRNLARAHGATLFSTLLTGFQIALAQWTGKEDIVVGTPVANRGLKSMWETMGYCAGIIPLRGQVEKDRSFSESLRQVHANTVDALGNVMPFVELTHALGEKAASGHNPIFQVRFALQNHPVPDVELPGLSARLQMRSTGTARFEMACEITEMSEALEVVFLFRRDLFSLADMQDLKELFAAALKAACDSTK